MEILLRKIQRKKDAFIFKPHSKGGFRFTVDLAQPSLTPFQSSCIINDSKKDKKLGSFSTPEFCFLGSLMVSDKSISLRDVFKKERLDVEEAFNAYFPEKKWYWYSKTEPHNLAVQTYFVGVRVVANIVAYYFQLQKTGQILEADSFYKNIIKPTGIERVLVNSDSSLITRDDFLYCVELSEANCVITANSISSGDIRESYIAEEKESLTKKHTNKPTTGTRKATKPASPKFNTKPSAQKTNEEANSKVQPLVANKEPIENNLTNDAKNELNVPQRAEKGEGGTLVRPDKNEGFRQRSEEELERIRNVRIPKISTSNNNGKENSDNGLGQPSRKAPKLPRFGDGDL